MWISSYVRVAAHVDQSNTDQLGTSVHAPLKVYSAAHHVYQISSWLSKLEANMQ